VTQPSPAVHQYACPRPEIEGRYLSTVNVRAGQVARARVEDASVRSNRRVIGMKSG